MDHLILNPKNYTEDDTDHRDEKEPTAGRINFFKQLSNKCPSLVISRHLHMQLTLSQWQQMACLPIQRIEGFGGMLRSGVESAEFEKYCELISSIQPPAQYIFDSEGWPG